MNEHEIVAKAEKQVKEWIDYAKKEYNWGDEVFELFEEPMIEVATSVAVQTTKDLQKENEQLKKEKIPQLERKIASIRGAHSVDCKKLNSRIQQVERLKQENNELRQKLSEAMHLIKNIIQVTWGEGWNYSLNWKVEAMQFLEDKECSQKECTILEQN